ncbi:hypothetical protein JCM10207_004574 [Rhodosporidiobolus poonsookiae]
MLSAVSSAALPTARRAGPSALRSFATSTPAREHFLNASPEAFEAQAVKGSKVTVVDFYADWCGPCRFLSPVLEKVVNDESGADLMTIDTDAHTELAQKYKITSLPTVLAFKEGRILAKFIGAQPESGVRKFVEFATTEGGKEKA